METPAVEETPTNAMLRTPVGVPAKQVVNAKEFRSQTSREESFVEHVLCHAKHQKRPKSWEHQISRYFLSLLMSSFSTSIICTYLWQWNYVNKELFGRIGLATNQVCFVSIFWKFTLVLQKFKVVKEGSSFLAIGLTLGLEPFGSRQAELFLWPTTLGTRPPGHIRCKWSVQVSPKVKSAIPTLS